jgi:hypothetical protein
MDNSSNLEVWVKHYQDAGQAWVAAKLKADQLDETTKIQLSSLMNTIEEKFQAKGEKVSESKLERLALDSDTYRNHVRAANLAKSDMLSKRVRFDALDKLFEAKRSGLSFEKEIIKKGIFSTGS